MKRSVTTLLFLLSLVSLVSSTMAATGEGVIYHHPFSLDALIKSIQYPHNKEWPPSEVEYQGSFPCTAKKCFTLKEISEETVKRGFESRKEWESVQQSRGRVLESLGQLLPRFEMTLGHGIDWPAAALDVVTNLLGFMIPSNWFSWKESKLNLQAQRYSYLTLLQQQLLSSKVIYYNIHQMQMQYQIYDYYTSRVGTLIEELKRNYREDGPVPADYILVLENFHADLMIEQVAIKNGLDQINSEVIPLFNLGENWNSFGIVAMDIDAETKQFFAGTNPEVLIPANFETMVMKNSTELKTITYLRHASKYATLVRIFDFFSVGEEGNRSIGFSIGLDNFARVKISRSQSRVLDIEKEKMVANLRQAIYRLKSNYRMAYDLYREADKGKVPNRQWLMTALGVYANCGAINTWELKDFIFWALRFETSKSQAKHLVLITKAEQEYLQGDSLIYSSLNQKLPEARSLHWWSDRIKIRENNSIDAAIARGELVLNEEI
ncbi:MAG: hypothetical protein HQK50_02375 [Oligoflexia bacterium]|nr:hypothetical protein [Oligoflexia bacterium]MBF0364385.1 hypothetical protein [Oligoflexia bacterium]